MKPWIKLAKETPDAILAFPNGEAASFLLSVAFQHAAWFGVPGDYNLGLMQQLEDRGEPAWIGNCNELNASYATDAYARINGLGAMIVTHGVGTFSAVNGIAGAYSEHVPVILISGSLPLRAVQRGDLMHHTLIDREKGNLCRIFAEITEAQGRLTPENAVAEIDRIILTAWRRKLPVYLELPSDIPYLEIEVPDSRLKLEMIPSEQESLNACSKMILERLHSAKSPAFLLDIDAMRFDVSKQIIALAERFQMQVATLNCAKGAFPENSPQLVEPTRVLQAPRQRGKPLKEAIVC